MLVVGDALAVMPMLLVMAALILCSITVWNSDIWLWNGSRSCTVDWIGDLIVLLDHEVGQAFNYRDHKNWIHLKFYSNTGFGSLQYPGEKRNVEKSGSKTVCLPTILLLPSHAHILRHISTFYLFFFPDFYLISLVCVENTRTVSRNLGCKMSHDENKSSNHVNVLIPEVIQV